MSFANAKVLKISDEMKKKMKLFCTIYVVMFISSILVLTWAVYTATAGLKDFISTNPESATQMMMSAGYGISPDMSQVGGQFKLARGVMQNLSSILFVLNVILLIVVIRYTNKNELPIFKQMIESKEIQSNTMLVPILLGFMFVVAVYLGFPWYATFLAHAFA